MMITTKIVQCARRISCASLGPATGLLRGFTAPVNLGKWNVDLMSISGPSKTLAHPTRTFSIMACHNASAKKSKPTSATGGSVVGVPQAGSTKAAKPRRRKWAISYSKITVDAAEKLLGVPLNLPSIPVEQMIKGKSGLLGADALLRAKKKVYEGLVRYMTVGLYPPGAEPEYKEANINDMVAFTVYPILEEFINNTPRKLRLYREKEITSKGSSTSGMEEFAVMDYISLGEKRYVLIVEAKKIYLAEVRKQCFLALRDMRDFNGGDGIVYGFGTIGTRWNMVSFDGQFVISDGIPLMFPTMATEEKRWMEHYSILVDCFNVALSHGAKNTETEATRGNDIPSEPK